MQIKLIVVVVYIRILFFGPRLMYSYFSADFSGGGSRILFRRGCTRLLLYFNTNRPHSFFFLQNTSCIRKPQVISGGRGVRTLCTLPLDPPLLRLKIFLNYSRTSTNGHLSTTAIFRRTVLTIHRLLCQPLCNSLLSTRVTFFCLHGGRCRLRFNCILNYKL